MELALASCYDIHSYGGLGIQASSYFLLVDMIFKTKGGKDSKSEYLGYLKMLDKCYFTILKEKLVQTK